MLLPPGSGEEKLSQTSLWSSSLAPKLLGTGVWTEATLKNDHIQAEDSQLRRGRCQCCAQSISLNAASQPGAAPCGLLCSRGVHSGSRGGPSGTRRGSEGILTSTSVGKKPSRPPKYLSFQLQNNATCRSHQMLSRALEGRARTHPGGPASASLALSRRMKQALRRRSSPPGERAPPVWDKVKEASSPVLPLLRGADVSPGSRHHQDVTAGSPGGARRTRLPVPGAVLAPEMPNTSSPMLEPLRKGAGGLRDGRGPHFPASGASEVISQVLGVASCASLCAGESLVRKMERGPLGGHLSVLWSGVTEGGCTRFPGDSRPGAEGREP